MMQDAQRNPINAYRTNELHFDFTSKVSQPGIVKYGNFQYRHDGNGVDMDKEQADLAANQIYYNALVDRLSSKFNSLQNVIKGGR